MFLFGMISGQTGSAQVRTGGNKIALSAGPEWNMNLHKNFAGGFILGFDYNLPSVPLAIGLSAAGSYSFTDSTVFEAASFLRWYFPQNNYSGLFTQADLGLYIVMEDNNILSKILGSLRGGYRFHMGSSLFFEPYGRFGYPFIFGIGLMAGVQL